MATCGGWFWIVFRGDFVVPLFSEIHPPRPAGVTQRPNYFLLAVWKEKNLVYCRPAGQGYRFVLEHL